MPDEGSHSTKLFKKLKSTGSERTSPVLLNYNNGPQQSETSATFVNIKINNQKCKVIVDSGAESTLVDYSVAKKLNLIIHEETDSVQYITANGEKLKTLGWC